MNKIVILGLLIAASSINTLRGAETQLLRYLAQPGVQLSMVQLILQNEQERENINKARDENGNTAFLKLMADNSVSGQDKITLLKELTKNGAKVDAVNNQGKTAAMLAVELNDPLVLKDLLRIPQISKMIYYQDKDGKNALFIGVEKRSCVQELVDAGANGVYSATGNNNNLMTPLMLAAQQNWLEGVKLLTNDIVINMQDINQKTALLYAAEKKLIVASHRSDSPEGMNNRLQQITSYMDIVKHLVSANADTTIKNKDGYDAYHYLSSLNTPWISTTDQTNKKLQDLRQRGISKEDEHGTLFWYYPVVCAESERVCLDKVQSQCVYYCKKINLNNNDGYWAHSEGRPH